MGKKIQIKVGDQFGRWTVLETDVYDPNSKAANPQKKNLCQCSCSKKTLRYLTSSVLKNGKSMSCGCARNEALAERNASKSTVKVGNVYGKLTVIKDLGMRKQSSRDKNERWSLCQCSCGSAPIEVKNNTLQNGWKKSCGCMQSQGEFVIEKILKDNNCNYIKEYKFFDLVGENGGVLRFDFAIFEKDKLIYLIEFDGRQHYTGPEASWTEGQSFETIKHHDQIKNDYCLKNNICLKRIPYTEIRTITYQRIITDEFNIACE